MKTAMCTLLLALALPAAALAGGDRGHHHADHRSTSTHDGKNAAWICKALRAQDPHAFAKAFGTNHNQRNAYGKCVSAHARAAKMHGVTLTFHDVTVRSAGTITSPGASGCQFTDAGCTVTSSGSLLGTAHGTYASSWTILWKQATSNGAGGYCAPASGTTTLTLPRAGTLTKAEQGTVCEVGPTGTNVEHVLNHGTFSVSGGSGLLSHASGSGSVSFDQKPDGTVTGSETFDTLTVTL